MPRSAPRSGKAYDLSIRRPLEPDDYPFFDYRRFSFSLGIAAAGRIWLSGSTAVRFEPPAGMVVKGDLVAQASVIHDKMAGAEVHASHAAGRQPSLGEMFHKNVILAMVNLLCAMAGVFVMSAMMPNYLTGDQSYLHLTVQQM